MPDRDAARVARAARSRPATSSSSRRRAAIALDAIVDGSRAPLGDPSRGPVTVELIQGLLLAFALVVILMPPYIRLLRAFGFGKQIRDRGPAEPLRQARDARRWAAC